MLAICQKVGEYQRKKELKLAQKAREKGMGGLADMIIRK